MLINADSGSGITNTLLDLIKQQDDCNYSVIDKIYLYIKDPNEGKDQYLIKKRENSGIKRLADAKTLIKFSSNMQDVYKIKTQRENANC